MGKITITYFVHGTTTDNQNEISTGWNPGELSTLGRQQAIDLGKQVADITFDVVFCSDLKRAVDSAELGFGSRYKIVKDNRLRECNYGDLNGKPASFSLDEHIETPFPNGESLMDVERRIASFLETLRTEYCNKHVAIVAHQAPQLALDVLIKGKSWQQAIAEDWRKTKAWKPGWEYVLRC